MSSLSSLSQGSARLAVRGIDTSRSRQALVGVGEEYDQYTSYSVSGYNLLINKLAEYNNFFRISFFFLNLISSWTNLLKSLIIIQLFSLECVIQLVL